MSQLLALVATVGICCSPAGAQVIERVSVSSAGDQGNRYSAYPSTSADGRFVAFHSEASNLVAGDTNGSYDVFVHDRQTAQTARVSVSSTGDQGNSNSFEPSIGGDGRFVAFDSYASNLVAGDTNGDCDIFVHDRHSGQTTRASVSTAGDQGNHSSFTPSISADGRLVAFYSLASNLVAGDTNGSYDVFVHDRQTGQTTRVSGSSTGDQGNSGSLGPSTSADGRFVTFSSYANNLVAADTNGTGDVFVRDRQTGQTARVSVSGSGDQGNQDSWSPSISPEGRFVAFGSFASNLVAGDTNGESDVFLHDRQRRMTTRVSVDSRGNQGNGGARYRLPPSVSADGRFVAFSSYASNLLPGDTNGCEDVFVAGTSWDPVPALSWLSTDGFESDGVDPDIGTPGQTLFRYRVKLTDPDGDEPDYVRVIIWKDGVRYLNRRMRPARGAGPTISGRVYKFSLRDPLPPGTYQYRFRARDDDGFASGPPTDWQCGPSMLPELLFGAAPGVEDGVRPNTGTADDTVFFWKVIYRDGDGDPAKFVRVLLWRDGSFYNVFRMINRDPEPDPRTGVVYRARRRLPAGSYEYRFEAEDKDGRAVGPASVKMSGLTVTAAAPLALTSLSAVRANAGAQITFSLSSAAQVQARILNIAGCPIKTLCHAKDCEAGSNTLLWNAQSETGLRVPNGTYLVEVVAKGSDGSRARALTQVRVSR